MGFEQAVPPVPSRLDELKMLDRLQESWLSQPNYRYYMNEDLRLTKMEYQKYNMATRMEFCRNFLVASLFSIPIAYMTRRFYLRSNWGSPIPFVRNFPYFEKRLTVYQDRTKAAHKTSLVTYIIATTAIAFEMTNWSYRSDQNYDKFSKVKRML